MNILVHNRVVQLRRGAGANEIVSQVKRRLKWPINRAYLACESARVEIQNDAELWFVARLLSELHCDGWIRETRAMEERCAAHMKEASDDEKSEAELHSEDDIDQDAFLMFGFRHELLN